MGQNRAFDRQSANKTVNLCKQVGISRRQFLALALLLPPGLAQIDSPVLVAGFVAALTGPDGFPTVYEWVESGSLADVTELGRPGYVAIYPVGLDQEWLAEFRASLQDLFPAPDSLYLPVVFK